MAILKKKMSMLLIKDKFILKSSNQTKKTVISSTFWITITLSIMKKTGSRSIKISKHYIKSNTLMPHPWKTSFLLYRNYWMTIASASSSLKKKIEKKWLSVLTRFFKLQKYRLTAKNFKLLRYAPKWKKVNDSVTISIINRLILR